MPKTIAEAQMDLSIIGPIIGAFGIVVVLISTLDFVMTTLTVSTNGYLTSTIALVLHRIGLNLFKLCACCRMKRLGHYIFSTFGVITVLSMIIFWIGTLWIGWTMIFFWNERTVLKQDYSLQIPVTLNLMGDLFLARLYFVGVTFVTLGYGDVIPSTHFFRILAPILGLQGFLTIGVIGTFIINIVTTLSRARSVAVRISHMGFSPSKILIAAWNGQDFHAIEGELSQLSSEVTSIMQTISVHPILFNYHSLGSDCSLVTRVSALDETLTALEYSMNLGLYIRRRPIPLEQAATIVEANKLSSDSSDSSNGSNSYCISINACEATDVCSTTATTGATTVPAGFSKSPQPPLLLGNVNSPFPTSPFTSAYPIPYKLNSISFHLCRNTITHFIQILGTHKMASIHREVPDLPINEPTWEVMKALGFPLKHESYHAFQSSFDGNEQLNMRRRILHAMVNYDGRKWEDVIDDRRRCKVPAITPEPEFA